MRKQRRRNQFLLVLGLLIVVVWLSGCAETWKGVQRDWQHWSDLDKEFQENWW